MKSHNEYHSDSYVLSLFCPPPLMGKSGNVLLIMRFKLDLIIGDDYDDNASSASTDPTIDPTDSEKGKYQK